MADFDPIAAVGGNFQDGVTQVSAGFLNSILAMYGDIDELIGELSDGDHALLQRDASDLHLTNSVIASVTAQGEFPFWRNCLRMAGAYVITATKTAGVVHFHQYTKNLVVIRELVAPTTGAASQGVWSDGRLAVCANGTKAELFDLTDGSHLWTYDHGGLISDVAIDTWAVTIAGLRNGSNETVAQIDRSTGLASWSIAHGLDAYGVIADGEKTFVSYYSGTDYEVAELSTLGASVSVQQLPGAGALVDLGFNSIAAVDDFGTTGIVSFLDKRLNVIASHELSSQFTDLGLDGQMVAILAGGSLVLALNDRTEWVAAGGISGTAQNVSINEEDLYSGYNPGASAPAEIQRVYVPRPARVVRVQDVTSARRHTGLANVTTVFPVFRFVDPVRVIGFVRVTDGAANQSIVITTPTKVDQFTTSDLHVLTTAGLGNDSIIVLPESTVRIAIEFSFSGSSGAEFDFEIFVDGFGTGLKCRRKLGAGGDVGAASIGGIVALGRNAEIDLRAVSLSGTVNLVIAHATFSVLGLA